MGLFRYGRTLLLGITVCLLGCGTVRQVTEALVGIERLRFCLQGVSEFRLVGVALADKRALEDFTPADAARLVAAYSSGQLPAEFTLHVAVLNPNDGVGGHPRLPITLERMEWRLLIDGVPTVTGVVTQPVEIPAVNQVVIIPVQLRLDLLEFFQRRRYEDLLRLALSIGGIGGGPSRLMLEVDPTLSTPVGRLRYPRPVPVIEKEFRP